MAQNQPMKKKPFRAALLALLALYLATGAYQMNKSLPEGTSISTPLRQVADVRFLADYTFVDNQGQRHTDQEIFDEAFRMIRRAQRLVVLDIFLFNDFAGGSSGPHRPLTDQLTRVLLERMEAVPGLRVVLITDPFNTLYGGVRNPYLDELRAHGVKVVMTDLTHLRDPNPAWSVFWRACCQWFGNDPEGGWLPSPVGTRPVTLRSWLELLNFKANHRKTLVVDQGDDWAALVTSGNPHNGSSAHSNVALRFSGPAARDLLETELAVTAFSAELADLPALHEAKEADSRARLQILTEGKIRDQVLATLNEAGAGDEIRLVMFYLSHRGVVEAMLRAHERGARIRVLLDPNKDAFGRKKGGIPNRQVGHELHEAGIPVRWVDTHGEQSHSKVLLHTGGDRATLILGSANFTRRNLDDFNLETDVRVLTGPDHPVIRDVRDYFERQWHNEPGRIYSAAYEKYADGAVWRYGLYRFMEATGLSTF